LITDNSKIGPRSRDLTDMPFKFPFSFFLGLSASIPSLKERKFLQGLTRVLFFFFLSFFETAYGYHAPPYVILFVWD